jgi:hypothetical protein
MNTTLFLGLVFISRMHVKDNFKLLLACKEKLQIPKSLSQGTDNALETRKKDKKTKKRNKKIELYEPRKQSGLNSGTRKSMQFLIHSVPQLCYPC